MISAATAAGKTEAAFLPICTTLLTDRDAAPRTDAMPSDLSGIKVLYVSPLKALINDQWGRLDSLCEHLDIPVHRWHGDVGASRKAALLARPDGILLITPESLEAIFVNQGPKAATLLRALRYVVIDEMHAFLGTERGAQLQSLLHRVDLAARRRVPRIGLSATLGDMSAARDYVRPGHGDKVDVVMSEDNEAQLFLQLRGYIAALPAPSVNGPAANSLDEADEPDDPTAETQHIADISTHLLRKLRGSTNLVFANSRTRVEQYADRLAHTSETLRVPNEFFPHHGSLSRELREDVEQRLKDPNTPTTAVCTSTLELGIDIGSVASVAQIGAPPSVAGLRQRLGRSGRREGESATLRIYISEPQITPQTHPVDTVRAELVQSIAMVDLLLQRWYEPLNSRHLHLSTLTQQVLSLIAQHGGVHPSEAHQVLCKHGPFQAVTPATFAQLLRDMGAAKLITQASDGLLLHDIIGERLVNHYSFYAAFRGADEYRLIAAGRTLGTLPVDFPVIVGTRVIFAGRRWTVLAVDPRQKVIELARSRGGRPPTFAGHGAAVSDGVRQQMLAVYNRQEVPAYLDATAQQLLDEARDYFRRWRLQTQSALSHGHDVLLFPWRSDTVHSTIAIMLAGAGLTAAAEGIVLSIQDTDLHRVRQAIEQIIAEPAPNPDELAAQVRNKAFEKYDEYLSEDLLSRGYAAGHLDVTVARQALNDILPRLGEYTAGNSEPLSSAVPGTLAVNVRSPLAERAAVALMQVPGAQRTATPSDSVATESLSVTFPSTRLKDATYAVLDVETTGFSPRLGHRVIEVAVIRANADGTHDSAWNTLINPLRGAGPTRVHGLTSADLDAAPTFAEIAGDLAAAIEGAVLVAHNAPFDLAFLAHEFTRLGAEPPVWATLCTLELATVFAPDLPSHTLEHCSEAEGLAIRHAHTALGDARATAQLLTTYLRRAVRDGAQTLADLGCPAIPVAGWAPWPPTGRHLRRPHRPARGYPAASPLRRAPVRSVGGQLYEAALTRALADGQISDFERTELGMLANTWGLTELEQAEVWRH